MKESIIFSGQNLTEIVHYVYRVTIDEKYYIGKRTGCLNDLHTGAYKTSSNIIKEKLKNGVTFSKIKILKVFSTSKEALEFENRILTRLNARTNPKFLNQTNGSGDFTFKQHTEKAKEKMREYFNPETEEGRKRREDMSKTKKALFDKNTESGRRNRENHSEIKIEFYNTEQGRKRRKNHSEFMKERFNPESEDGRKRLEYMFNIRREQTKEHLQNRKNSSILGELMFDEAFIKENFLITDDKNNPRFLWSVYSKLTGYSKSSIVIQKREGKLRFLYGIKSIKFSEELENAKIKEIEAIIKSRN